MKDFVLYHISKVWNRFAYFVMWIGWKMIWDQTGINGDLLTKDKAVSRRSEIIMTSF
jgi:hypothetical protein